MTLSIIRSFIPGWGTIYSPPGTGPFPAIMILHGSEGAWSGWSHRDAVIFAAHGFVSFPFGYSNDGNVWNAGNIIDVPLDQTVEALEALRNCSFVTPNICIYGVSRGAEHALLLASLMARDNVRNIPQAIAVHSPPDVICGAFDGKSFRDAGDPGWLPWDPSQRAWSWRGSSENLLPTQPIEIERFEGPLFLSHGTADQVWSVEMTRRLVNRLHRHHKNPEVYFYEGQDHGLDNPSGNDHVERVITFFKRNLALTETDKGPR